LLKKGGRKKGGKREEEYTLRNVFGRPGEIEKVALLFVDKMQSEEEKGENYPTNSFAWGKKRGGEGKYFLQ